MAHPFPPILSARRIPRRVVVARPLWYTCVYVYECVYILYMNVNVNLCEYPSAHVYRSRRTERLSSELWQINATAVATLGIYSYYTYCCSISVYTRVCVCDIIYNFSSLFFFFFVYIIIFMYHIPIYHGRT